MIERIDPRRIENVVVLSALMSSRGDRFRTARSYLNWFFIIAGQIVVTLCAIGNLSSLFSNEPVFSGLGPTVVRFSLAALFEIPIFFVARDLFRTSQAHQRAAHYLHMLGHRLRDNLRIDSLEHHQTRVDSGEWESLDKLLYDTVTDVSELFQRLVSRGKVSAELLVPVSEAPDGKITTLLTGVWSRPSGRLLRARRAEGRNGDRHQTALTVGGSVAGYVWRTRSSVLVRDAKVLANTAGGQRGVLFDCSERTRGATTFEYVRSLICVPVVLQHEPLLVLAIDCSEAREFHSDHVDIARLCADLISLALNAVGLAKVVARGVVPAPQRDDSAHTT